jgi:hypothetical protein
MQSFKQYLDEDLRQWFKQKWVRMDTKGNIKGDCAREPGEGKPKCLPQAKAHAIGKEARASAAQRKRREDPNPERRGAPINVKTEETEQIDEISQKTALNYSIKRFAQYVKPTHKSYNDTYEVMPKKHQTGIDSALERMKEETVEEKWSQKYKKSINCNNPKGFSQKAHCQGREKNEEVDEACWDGYTAKGMKKKGNRMVPNCVKEDGAMGGSAGPTNVVGGGAIAGTGGKGGEPGVYLPRRKKSPVMMSIRRKSLKA